jgi:hypothetical protein
VPNGILRFADFARDQARALPQDSIIAYLLSETYWLKGMYPEAQRELERALSLEHDDTALAGARAAWAKGGEKAVALWGAERMKAQSRTHFVEALDIAEAIAFTGAKDETMKYLDAAYQEHDLSMVEIQTDPVFDFLHEDPRYIALVKKIGVPLATPTAVSQQIAQH